MCARRPQQRHAKTGPPPTLGEQKGAAMHGHAELLPTRRSQLHDKQKLAELRSHSNSHEAEHLPQRAYIITKPTPPSFSLPFIHGRTQGEAEHMERPSSWGGQAHEEVELLLFLLRKTMIMVMAVGIEHRASMNTELKVRVTELRFRPFP
ncbi:hypothetical protein Dimus_027001 [Dionaea muscipula]